MIIKSSKNRISLMSAVLSAVLLASLFAPREAGASFMKMDSFLEEMDGIVTELGEGGLSDTNTAAVENRIEAESNTGGNSGSAKTGNSQSRVEVRNQINDSGESRVKIIIEGNGEKKVIERKVEEKKGKTEIINDISVKAENGTSTISVSQENPDSAAALEEEGGARGEGEEVLRVVQEGNDEADQNKTQEQAKPVLIKIWEGIAATVQEIFAAIARIFGGI